MGGQRAADPARRTLSRVSIHHEHPFADAAPDRDPVRRLRGRLGGAVTLWATGEGDARVGLTMSSVMVAGGEHGSVLGLVDPDSDLGLALVPGERFTVTVLSWRERRVADAFSGTEPAPGGPFRQTDWDATEFGPVPLGAAAWAGAVVMSVRPVGWSLLVEAALTTVVLREDPAADGGDADPLLHLRGRYRRPAPLAGGAGVPGAGG